MNHHPYLLTETQLEAYYQQGYLVLENLVPVADIDEVMQAAHEKQRVVENGDDNWQYASFDFANPEADFPLHALLANPNVVSAVEQVFEAPARVFYGMLAVVAAHKGNGLPWHQDNQYQHILGKALNIFIALCDITPDKANLWVAPGSHTNGLLPYRMSETYKGHREAINEPYNAVLLPTLRKGDACIFNRYTLHRSLKNQTAEDRYAYAAQYCEVSARRAEDGVKYQKPTAHELMSLFSTQGVHAKI